MPFKIYSVDKTCVTWLLRRLTQTFMSFISTIVSTHTHTSFFIIVYTNILISHFSFSFQTSQFGLYGLRIHIPSIVFSFLGHLGLYLLGVSTLEQLNLQSLVSVQFLNTVALLRPSVLVIDFLVLLPTQLSPVSQN